MTRHGKSPRYNGQWEKGEKHWYHVLQFVQKVGEQEFTFLFAYLFIKKKGKYTKKTDNRDQLWKEMRKQ